MRYFEDFNVGDEWLFDSWSVDKQQAFDFATQYDPQPIHLDEHLASKTHFGGTIVSGWQTLLISVRKFIDGVMKETAGLASPGIDGIEWLAPVKAGAVVTSGARVIDVRSSKSKPDRGLVWIELFANNETGEQIMSSKGVFFIARKP
jgi:acyl dehydratase